MESRRPARLGDEPRQLDSDVGTASELDEVVAPSLQHPAGDRRLAGVIEHELQVLVRVGDFDASGDPVGTDEEVVDEAGTPDRPQAAGHVGPTHPAGVRFVLDLVKDADEAPRGRPIR